MPTLSTTDIGFNQSVNNPYTPESLGLPTFADITSAIGASKPGAFPGTITVIDPSTASASKLTAPAYNASGIRASTASSPGTVSQLFTGTAPDVVIPREAKNSAIAMFNDWWPDVDDDLTDRLGWLLNTYFPDGCGYLQKAQDWICKALTEGGTGINPNVENLIWFRDRDRLIQEGEKQKLELRNTYAARGYPLPTGFLQEALYRIDADTQDKLAKASRDIAIKQAEIEIENVRFAVDKAIELRTKVFSATADFVKGLITLAGQGAVLMPSVTDSQSKLISAAADYYRAQVSAVEVTNKHYLGVASLGNDTRLKNAELLTSVAEKNAELELRAYEGQAKNDIELAHVWQKEFATKVQAKVEYAKSQVGVYDTTAKVYMAQLDAYAKAASALYNTTHYNYSFQDKPTVFGGISAN